LEQYPPDLAHSTFLDWTRNPLVIDLSTQNTAGIRAPGTWRGRKATTMNSQPTPAKEAALAARQLALPNKVYGVIVADPPWRFEPYSRESGLDRSADNHYPTSGVEDIAALPVANIAAHDCVLFLWATAPCLEFALAVMKAWGFAYKSQYIWVKNRIGTGYWSRNKHEILLVGTRGHIPAPAPGTQWASVIEAPVGAHSVKPDKALEMIESYFPHLNATRRPPHIKARVLMSNRITTN
jgi:N6-adenosine-specific RNA methylase IME4